MGFAVDHELLTLTSAPQLFAANEASRWWEDPGAVRRPGRPDRPPHDLAPLRALDRRLWRDLLTGPTSDQSVLLIGHSGELEAGLVACLPGRSPELGTDLRPRATVHG